MRDFLSGQDESFSICLPVSLALIARHMRCTINGGIERLNLSDNQVGGRYKYSPHTMGANNTSPAWEDDTRGIFARAFAKMLAGEPGEFGMKPSLCSLRSVDLSSNCLSAKGAVILARGLALNGTLVAFLVAFNPKLGDDGAVALIEASGSDVSNLEM